VNAIDLLKEDHKKVADLFDKVRSASESRHPALFAKIKAELDVHTHIEETVFYPRLLKDGNKELKDITNEGLEEHHQVKMFLKELVGIKNKKDVFEAKLTVLMEDVEHHVEEEEDEMFPLVEDQFEESALEKLGVAMLRKKKAFIGKKPATAKNLVKPKDAGKGTMAKIYEAAVGAVGEMFTGNDKPPKRSGRTAAKAGNGNSSPKKKKAVAAGNGRSTKTKSTAADAKRTSKAGLKPLKSSSTKSRSSSGRRGSDAK